MEFSAKSFENRDYSAQHTYWLGQALQAAWKGREVIRRWGTMRGLACTPFVKGQSEAYILASPELILCAFPGSKEFGDWLDNIRAITKIRWPELNSTVRVSRGFRRQYLRIGDRLQNGLILACTHNSLAEVVFAGHSLGSMNALQAAIEWRMNRRSSMTDPLKMRRPCQVYLLEPPRLGNRELAQFVETELAEGEKPRVYRVVHAKGGIFDPVVNLPPEFLSFWQTGEPKIYDGSKFFRRRNTFNQYLEMTRQKTPRWRLISRAVRLGEGIGNHLVSDLLKTLREGGHVETGAL